MLADILKGVNIERVDHCQRENSSEFVNRQQVMAETKFLRNVLKQLFADIVVEQTDVRDLALLNQEGDERGLAEHVLLYQDLAQESPCGLLHLKRIAQLSRRNNPFLNEQLAQPRS